MRVEQRIESINRSQIARETGLHVSYVNRVLKGQRDPTFSVATRVARAVGVSLDELSRYLENVTAA